MEQRTPFGALRFLCLAALSSEWIRQKNVDAWTYHYNNKGIYVWDEAREFCQKYYTDLVAIQNQKEISYLNGHLPRFRYHYWIGIRKVAGVWTWVGTGKPLTKEAENWADHEPNNKGSSQDCVEIYIKGDTQPGKWNDEPCNRRKRALCYRASCQPDSCSQRGECVETIGNYTCSCLPGFSGPECESVTECKDLRAIPHQPSMTCSHPLGYSAFDSTCNFSCPEGFELQGAASLQCLASGDWSAEIPQCTAVRCRPPERPDRGDVSCSPSLAELQFNSMCRFRCEEGFVLNGSETVWCGASGEWTTPAPTCEVIRCPSLESPERGTVKCHHPIGPFAYDSRCDFRCPPGFRPSGSATLRCTALGLWTAPPPVCRVVECEPPEIPAHGAMDCSLSGGRVLYNSSCDFRCAEGFTLNGAETVSCSASGDWTASVPTCQAVRCQDLEGLVRSQMTCSHPFGDFAFQSTCNFTCEEGFQPAGPKTLHCLATGHWTSLPPVCQAVQCKPLLTPRQGTISCVHPVGNFSFKSTCQFTCLEGFSLNGSETPSCTEAGLWTAPPPTCQAVQCKPLLTPQQGRMSCVHPVGDSGYKSTCQFTCHEGFSLNGSETLSCTEAGLWTAPPPTCQAIQCPELQAPTHGLVNCSDPPKRFGFNSSCDFGCSEGFVLRGPGVVRCETTGNWTDRPPVCEVIRCPYLEASKPLEMNCSHPLGNFSYGSACEFHCPKGQVLNSSPTIWCQGKGEWSDKMPTCQGGALSVQEALTYLGATVAGVTSLLVGGTLLALLRKHLRRKDDGKTPLNPCSHLGTPGVFTNAAFDSSS
ncbi:P-selectin isoform X1 [Ornithorhynchus anatinus]|uniref:p-selectin n=1 Tax=Ornithorhynchus anatinus TaxID=9258 RepID=A0A6I8NEZ5_ORNAN|nr:P-selectin isoform X1 [Ornithorhynchus anatinus]